MSDVFNVHSLRSQPPLGAVVVASFRRIFIYLCEAGDSNPRAATLADLISRTERTPEHVAAVVTWLSSSAVATGSETQGSICVAKG